MASAFITGRRPDTDIRLRRETWGGALYDLGCYTVSMALRMMGKEPAHVRAASQFSEKHIDLFTQAMLVYDDGAVADLSCGMLTGLGRLDRFVIRGTAGEITSPVEFNQCGQIPYTVTRGGRTETRTVAVPNNYMLEAEQLSRCVLYGEAPKVTKEFSLMTARVTDRILSAVGY